MDGVYRHIQDLFQRGTVIIIGSGASCAYGLPSMSDLAQHLLETIPGKLPSEDQQSELEWTRIASALADQSALETALGVNPLPDALVDLLMTEVGIRVARSEGAAIANIFGSEISPFGRLFAHILRSAQIVDVVTTNYDRLIEVQAARAGIRVDSMYYGHTVGRLNAELSRDELLMTGTSIVRSSRTVLLRPRPHIRLSKPHGSLDWFEQGGDYFRTDLAIPGSRQIIAPGGNKYRLGYEVPFDQQRQRANQAIDAAASLLTVGYGFNDEHLQTHLERKFSQVPAVVISRTLTENARAYLQSSSRAIGIEALGDGSRCVVSTADDSLEIDLPLWDLNHLAREVLSI
ncbi:SIR2 family protein [Rathayibacter festucae]